MFSAKLPIPTRFRANQSTNLSTPSSQEPDFTLMVALAQPAEHWIVDSEFSRLDGSGRATEPRHFVPSADIISGAKVYFLSTFVGARRVYP